jgi:hypothetical protein
MQRYTHFTAVPKFTCEIRTSLSNLTELFPQLSIFHATANPSLVTDASLGSQTQNIPASHLIWPDSLQSLNNIRKVVDIIEPHHMRQFFTSLRTRSVWWMSYCFSVIRWRKEILYIQPNLEHDITVVENHYHVSLCRILKEIDTKLFYTKEQRPASAAILNTIYEVVCSLKYSHTANHATITGYLEALTDRISHLYCMLVSDKSSIGKHEREKYDYFAEIFACFTRTSVLLPPDWQGYVTVVKDITVLKARAYLLTLRLEHMPELPQFSRLSKDFYPYLERYIPAQFLIIFGFNADSFCGEESEYWSLCGTEHILSFILNHLEGLPSFSQVHAPSTISSKSLVFSPEIVTSNVLALAPCALAIAMRHFLQIWDAEKFRTPRRDAVQMIVALSVRVCLEFFTERLFDHRYDSAWLDPQSHLSTLMYTWAEEKGDVLFRRDHLYQRGVLKRIKNEK